MSDADKDIREDFFFGMREQGKGREKSKDIQEEKVRARSRTRKTIEGAALDHYGGASCPRPQIQTPC